MYEPVQKCTNCGAGLTLDDLRVPNCKYCGTVLPHRAQAEQHAQLVGQVMGNMMAQQAQVQDAWRNAYGAPPMGAPPGAQFGPYGGAGPYGPNGPYANPHAIAAAQVANVVGISRMVRVIIALVTAFIALAIVGGVMACSLVR